ncbi:hypothetical protein Bbelb_121620 [Branchiostoma belcheri]|nr:hypothetical protein Bbelb_121620 [Branchiostoma belcheri]
MASKRQRLEELESEFKDVPSGIQRKALSFCPKHTDQVLTFYCEPCQTLVCVACTVVDHPRGEKHNPIEVGTVAERKKRYIDEMLRVVEGRIFSVQDMLNDVEKEIVELPRSADKAIEEATGYFDRLMALLQDRKEEVIKEIGSRRQEVGKYLETQKEAIEFELAGLMSTFDSCVQALEHGSDVHVIEVEGQTRPRVEELLKTLPTDRPVQPSHVVFSEGTAVAEFGDAVAKAGCVQVKAKVDTIKSWITVKPAVVKMPSVALLTTRNSKYRLCVVAEEDVTATLTDSFGQAVPTQLQKHRKREGVLKICYTPEVTGIHELEVKVNGLSVGYSFNPIFKVKVQSRDTQVLTIGGEEAEVELSGPTDIAVDKDGNIAVLEKWNQRVLIFDAKTGQLLRWFPVHGRNHSGIGIDSNGQFFVTRKYLFSSIHQQEIISYERVTHGQVYQKQAILVYSQDGKLTKTLQPDWLEIPTGITVLKDGRMVVVDDWQKSCLLLKPDGTLIREIGKGHLRNPRSGSVAVDESRGLLVATDILAHKVFVFDFDEGNLKFRFGEWGVKEGEHERPAGITFDPAGNIVVVDYNNRRMQVLKPDGTYLRTVAMVKSDQPAGLALTPDGLIAVACESGNCVELYKYE